MHWHANHKRLFLLLLLLSGGVALAPRGVYSEEETEVAPAPAKEDPDEKRVRDFPIPLKQKASGVRVPHFSENGKILSQFIIGTAQRMTDELVQMERVTMEMYDDDGKAEYIIDLPASVLDLRSGKLTSDEPVTIKNPKFELKGEKMEFDTKSKEGRLLGNVHMTILELEGFGQKADKNE